MKTEVEATEIKVDHLKITRGMMTIPKTEEEDKVTSPKLSVIGVETLGTIEVSATRSCPKTKRKEKDQTLLKRRKEKHF